MTRPAYEALRARFRRAALVGEAGAMLGWDASAMMPEGGAAARGEQLATLAGLAHEMLVAPETGEALGRAADELAGEPADGWDGRNLALMRRAHARATALPAALVEARARAESACEMTWRGAKAESDFARVLPSLATLVGIVREEAALLGAAAGVSPYDALLDGFQPGLAEAAIAPVFDRYERFLDEVLPQAERIERDRVAPVPMPAVSPDRQEALCRALAGRMGLDWAHARLDRSLHPFCGGTPSDVRITTRYDADDPSRALMGVLHETGHALYERGLPERWAREPVGEAAGMAAHESQSLIVEMQACRSDAFLGWLAPTLAAAFGDESHPAWAAANLRRLWRRVERSFVRVDADELTYPAHVILRFRLERQLVAGTLAPADLPEAWGAEMERLLGIRPRDDREGCLQDIHWYAGLYGYFPSYSIGAMAAAQLMEAARRERGDIDDALGRGELAPLLDWLRERVHRQGSRHGFAALMEAATGNAFGTAPFERHLRARYLAAAA